MRTLRVWDQKDGDAEVLANVANESYDFVHSSHCLEHLHDPRRGLQNWFRVLRQGGFLVFMVPDEDLYEQGVFPSTFNSDHKWTFTISKVQSWSQKSINVCQLIQGLGGTADIIKIELLDSGYRYNLPRFDQTLTPIAECGIEVVVRKRLDSELARKGRLPAEGAMSSSDFTRLTGFRLS